MKEVPIIEKQKQESVLHDVYKKSKAMAHEHKQSPKDVCISIFILFVLLHATNAWQTPIYFFIMSI